MLGVGKRFLRGSLVVTNSVLTDKNQDIVIGPKSLLRVNSKSKKDGDGKVFVTVLCIEETWTVNDRETKEISK